MQQLKNGSWLLYIITAILLAIPLFGFLDSQPIQRWDESRNAVNALQMQLSGDYLVSHYGHQPDHWNTKPPLLLWLQSGLMNFLGPSVLAVRLPSAIAAFLCSMLMLFFFHRYFGRIYVGVFSALILVTSYGYIVEHGARTGDFDVLLSLFVLGSILSLFLFIVKKKNSYLYLFFLCLLLGALTKGITIFIFGPFLLLYLILQGALIPLLKNRHFYFGLIGLIIPIAAYYLLRENADPGYLQAVYQNELGGRFNDSLEGHLHPFDHYYYELKDRLFSHWFYLIPFGIIFGLSRFAGRFRKLSLLLVLTSLGFLLIISSAETKLNWYPYQIIPLLSMLIAIFIGYCYQFIHRKLPQIAVFKAFVFLGFGAMVFFAPYEDILYYTNHPPLPPEKDHLYSSAEVLHKYLKEDCPEEIIRVVDSDYVAHISFYCLALSTKDCQVHQAEIHDLRSGDVALVQNAKLKYQIYSEFNTELLQRHKHADLIKLLSLKH